MASQTMAAGFVAGMAEFALRRGVEERALFAGTRLSIDRMSRPERPLPLEEVAAVWGQATHLSGDPAFSLHLGENSACSSLSIVGMIGESAATLGDALERVIHFAALGGTRTGGPYLTLQGREARVEMKSPPSEFGKWMAENNLGRMVTGMRNGVVGSFGLIRADFRHAKPAYAAEYDRIFRAPVNFDQETNGIVFDPDLLELPLQRPNAYLNRILTERAEQALTDSDAKGPTQRVSDYLRAALPMGATSANDCAKALGMSRQTLHRQLKEEGRTFREMLDEIRKQSALDDLATGHYSISEIATRLGFSESSSFNRAFKRWTGSSPSEMRT